MHFSPITVQFLSAEDLLAPSDWNCTFEERRFKNNLGRRWELARVTFWLEFHATMQAFATGRLKSAVQECMGQYPQVTIDALVIDP